VRSKTHQHPFFKNSPGGFHILVYHSLCIVSNSSVAIRECSFLGVPAVNISSPGGQSRLNLINVNYSRQGITEAVRTFGIAPPSGCSSMVMGVPVGVLHDPCHGPLNLQAPLISRFIELRNNLT
jgi:hypothetical protein